MSMIVNHLKKEPLFTVSSLKYSKQVEVVAHRQPNNIENITHRLSLTEARALKNALVAQIKNVKRRKK